MAVRPATVLRNSRSDCADEYLCYWIIQIAVENVCILKMCINVRACSWVWRAVQRDLSRSLAAHVAQGFSRRNPTETESGNDATFLRIVFSSLLLIRSARQGEESVPGRLSRCLWAAGQGAARSRNIFSWWLSGRTQSIGLNDEVLWVLLCAHPKLKQSSRVALCLKSQPEINSWWRSEGRGQVEPDGLVSTDPSIHSGHETADLYQLCEC